MVFFKLQLFYNNLRVFNNLHTFNTFNIFFLFSSLFSCLLNNGFRSKLYYVVVLKNRRHRFIWLRKNFRSYKIDNNNTSFNFNLKLVCNNSKKNNINKIIKSKRLTGLFKRKYNMRITILKRRSLIFNLFNQKDKNYFRGRWFKNRNRYRVMHFDLEKRVKLIFFKNREIIKNFIKKKNIKKQNKLSTQLMNFINKDSKSLLNLYEYRLANILIKSHFFNNLSDSLFFIRSGFITVNNTVVTTFNYIVKLNDVIKFKGRSNYYFFYRRSLNKSVNLLKKINWAFFKFRKKQRSNRYFPKVYKWIDSNKNFGFDIPFFIEVDFINMTLFILFKNFDLNSLSYPNIKYINFYLTRLYNWNYIV